MTEEHLQKSTLKQERRKKKKKPHDLTSEPPKFNSATDPAAVVLPIEQPLMPSASDDHLTAQSVALAEVESRSTRPGRSARADGSPSPVASKKTKVARKGGEKLQPAMSMSKVFPFEKSNDQDNSKLMTYEEKRQLSININQIPGNNGIYGNRSFLISVSTVDLCGDYFQPYIGLYALYTAFRFLALDELCELCIGCCRR